LSDEAAGWKRCLTNINHFSRDRHFCLFVPI